MRTSKGLADARTVGLTLSVHVWAQVQPWLLLRSMVILDVNITGGWVMGPWELSVLLTFLLNQNYTIIKSLTNTINFRSTSKPSEASIPVFTGSIQVSQKSTEIVILHFSLETKLVRLPWED